MSGKNLSNLHSILRRARFLEWYMAVPVCLVMTHPTLADPDVASMLAAAASRDKAPISDLDMLNTAVATLEETGTRLFSGKVRNRHTGTVVGITLNEQGARINDEAEFRRESALQAQKYGKMGRTLYAKLQSLQDDDYVAVTIQIKDPNAHAIARPTIEEALLKGREVVRQEMVVRANVEKRRIAAIVDPFVSAVQAAGGMNVVGDESLPFVSAVLQKRDLFNVAALRKVQEIFLQEDYRGQLNISRPTIGLISGGLGDLGFYGNGEKVAIIESTSVVFGSLITGTNRKECSIYEFAPIGPVAHSTLVAGIVGSHDGTYRGVAPAVTVLGGSACTYNDADLQTAQNWAGGQGAYIFNHSWGTQTNGLPTAMSKWLDLQTTTYWRSSVVAAGNDTNASYVFAPGVAYNVITVGASDDRNTTSFSDDIVWTSSTSRNPVSTYNDREKPELIAPGANIMTTDVNQTTKNIVITTSPGSSGTTFAAPHVSATLALILDINPALGNYPEVLKPLVTVMTNDRFLNGNYMSGTAGAGELLVNGILSYAPGSPGASNSFWRSGVISAANTSANPITQVFNFSAGVRVKIAANWLAYDWSDYNNRPSSDLDMDILDPSGNLLVGSYRFDSTMEYITFVAPTTGTYKVRLSSFRWNLPTNAVGYYGIAAHT